jgi:hypothetical protein
MREGQPHGDQTRESQPEAVKDNPPVAPKAQRPIRVSLNRRELGATLEMLVGLVEQVSVDLGASPYIATIGRSRSRLKRPPMRGGRFARWPVTVNVAPAAGQPKYFRVPTFRQPGPPLSHAVRGGSKRYDRRR